MPIAFPVPLVTPISSRSQSHMLLLASQNSNAFTVSEDSRFQLFYTVRSAMLKTR